MVPILVRDSRPPDVAIVDTRLLKGGGGPGPPTPPMFRTAPLIIVVVVAVADAVAIVGSEVPGTVALAEYISGIILIVGPSPPAASHSAEGSLISMVYICEENIFFVFQEETL